MNCLCCGRPVLDSAGKEELSSGWHVSCVKKFFHTSKLPEIDLSEETVLQIATESTKKGYTVPGVQKKLSLHLEVGTQPRLTIVNYPIGFILKPQTADFQALPEAEYLIMQMAAATGIKTVTFALLQMPAHQDSFAYITKRMDRMIPNSKTGQPQKLAMEDFCQLDGRLTQDKYRGSYERCAKIIAKYSMNPGLDLSELFLRIAFSYAIGNSDMHLKNFSLIETKSGSQSYVLSAAYDMLPTNVVMPEDEEQLALTLNGKKSNLHRNDFMVFADTCGIPAKSAEKMINKIASMQSMYLSMCRGSYMPESMKELLGKLIVDRAFK
jgi:serine/threonine-protein kinase HipA